MNSSEEQKRRQDKPDTEPEVVRVTIVGGRPPARGRLHTHIPRGIEVLVKKASVDPAFRQTLLERRAEAAQDIDLDLTSSEVAMLNTIPATQLDSIIANTQVPEPQRRVFLGKVATMMLTAIGATACRIFDGPKITGIEPDLPTPTPEAPTGSRPDDPTTTPSPQTLGIRPDNPTLDPEDDSTDIPDDETDIPVNPRNYVTRGMLADIPPARQEPSATNGPAFGEQLASLKSKKRRRKRKK